MELLSSSTQQSLTGARLPSCNFTDTLLTTTSFKPLRISARQRPSVEKLYNIFVEKNVTQERKEQLGVERWRRWESGKACFDWRWKVDEQVYITKGSIQVTPLGCPDSAWFYAGDVVRFPKWFSATLNITGDYEQQYRFLAYGEGEG